jgi:hypothetical protein
MSIQQLNPRRAAIAGVAAILLASSGVVSASTSASSAQDSAAALAASGDGGHPTISQPVPGKPRAVITTEFDANSVGYTETEHFMSGTAHSFVPNEPLTPDGHWSVRKAADNAAYKTRIISYTPSPEEFSGTVYVSWLNVSVGQDLAPDWLYAHNEAVRQGAAFVLVSAQKRGLDNAIATQPARYGSLSHPGDSFSYDIFSQAGRVLKDDPSQLIGNLKPTNLVAIGVSQSADRLNTYVNAVQPLEKIYDGFFLWSKVSKGPAINRPAYPLSQAPQADVPAPSGTRVRTDQVPVLDFTTEWDAEALPENTVTQPDSALYRAWHVAGTGHADAYQNYWAEDTGSRRYVRDVAQGTFDAMINPVRTTPFGTCAVGINVGVMHYTSEAALRTFDRWVRTGIAPASAPRFELVKTYPEITLNEFAFDDNGVVRGGIRTPFVDAPIAVVTGRRGANTATCSAVGTTTPFTASKLSTLYPTHSSFVKKWTRSTEAAVDQGWILPEHEQVLKQVGATSHIGQ